jgi:hypothetical protein
VAIAFDPPLPPSDRSQLAEILRVDEGKLDDRLALVAAAAAEEYLEQFLGRKVFTRGSDIREYRLLCLIKRVYKSRFPTEGEISALFQTTASQSRALIRAVASKYQYELGEIRAATLKDSIEQIKKTSGDDWQLNEPSDFVVEALNALLASLDGTLTRLIRKEGTVCNYVVKPATREALRDHFGVTT